MREQVLNTSSNQWDDSPSLLASLWRYRWLVLAGVLLGGLVGYGFSARQPRQYEAVARLLLSPPAGDSGKGDPDRYTANEALFISSSPVVFRAAELAGLPPATWRHTLAVQPVKDVDLIVIRVRASTGKDAAKLANSVVAAYQQVRAKRARDENAAAQAEVEKTTDKLSARLDELDARLQLDGDDPLLRAQRQATEGKLNEIVSQGVQASVAESGIPIQVSERAAIPTQPVEPRPRRTAAAGALFSLFAVSALTWLLNRRQLQAAPAKAPDEARHDQAALMDLPGDHVPVLGTIPDLSGAGVDGPVPTVTAPQSLATKSYQTVAQRLEFAARKAELKAVLITSPEPGDGKTLTLLNVGITAGQNGTSIIVVDADLRRRELSELCEINGRVGLTDMIDGKHDMTIGQYTWLVQFPGIQVIPCGSVIRDTRSVFTGPSFGAAMSAIREHGDLVLIDSPALSEGPEALEMAHHVDAAVMVVNPRTPLGVLQAARRQLDAAGIPVLGYVVNGEVSRGQVKHQGNGSSPVHEHGLRPATDAGIEWGSAS
jgi:Mrp family chromosome partitioning ATPase